MSAKGRAAEGYVPDPNGFFATQPAVTRAVLPFLMLACRPGARVLEPSCGSGAIGKVLRSTYGKSIEIVGVEIDRKRADKARKAQVAWVDKTHEDAEYEEQLLVFDDVIHGDFYEAAPAGLRAPYDAVLTNPSFSIWLPFAEHCFKFGPTTLLLPLNAVASKKRTLWWREHPAHLRVLSKRPSFAISVKCIASTEGGRKLGHARCEYQKLIALDAKVPKACPLCSEKIITTRSDSSEYAWVTWAEGIERGTWEVIDTPEVP